MKQAQRRFGWLAILVILWATLAPGFAHALKPAKPRSSALAPWDEICTVAGSSTPGAMARQDGGRQTGGLQHHCVFCQTHGGDLPLPATTAFLLVNAIPSAALPASAADQSIPQPAYLAARPRGPPSLS